MKKLVPTPAALMVAASILVFLAACKKQAAGREGSASLPFQITNGVMRGESVWIILATNGVSFTLFSNRVSVGVGTITEATIWYDAQEAVFTNILLDIRDSEGKQQWVRDQNADGVPESRRQRGSKYSEAFLEGAWVPFEPRDGTYAIALSATQKFRIFHNGARWQRLPEPAHKADH